MVRSERHRNVLMWNGLSFELYRSVYYVSVEFEIQEDSLELVTKCILVLRFYIVNTLNLVY